VPNVPAAPIAPAVTQCTKSIQEVCLARLYRAKTRL
jgi:hypothetical protein